MIKIYGMDTCPDCINIKKQIEGNKNFQYIDIGNHVIYLKEFIKIRDNNPIFNKVKENGSIGIPCFVLEDGSITLTSEDVGLISGNVVCSLEDHKKGKKGC